MRGWGLGYFRTNAEGHVTVHPDQAGDRAIDLYRLALDLHAQGIGLPLLLRFSDILKARIGVLATEFRRAIEETAYAGSYTSVYPIRSISSATSSRKSSLSAAPSAWGSSAAASPSCRRCSASPSGPII